jgi:formate dehydrogenase maturation protein FdhE
MAGESHDQSTPALRSESTESGANTEQYLADQLAGYRSELRSHLAATIEELRQSLDRRVETLTDRIEAGQSEHVHEHS